MSELQTRFEQAAREVQELPKRPDDQTLLKLYAFYKQATQGNPTGRRPGFTDVVGRTKYDAWARLRGKSPEWAMQAYIDLVTELQGKV